ncbi:MAG: hypothetical protein KKC05_00195 [Nanoarchaeota archaeon]|nr:hypothetical protein [Nanoarchaeota archaeon]
MKIFVFGNPLVDQDSLPLKLITHLQESFPEIIFVELDPQENLEDIGGSPVILDTVFGIKEVKVIEDIDKLEDSPRFSMHDFDLGTNLKLLRKMGKIDSVKIIGVPPELSEEEALGQIYTILKDIFNIGKS